MNKLLSGSLIRNRNLKMIKEFINQCNSNSILLKSQINKNLIEYNKPLLGHNKKSDHYYNLKILEYQKMLKNKDK